MAAEIISTRHSHAICFEIGRIPIYPGTQRNTLIVQQGISTLPGDGHRRHVDARLVREDAPASGRRRLGGLRRSRSAASSPGRRWAHSLVFNLASAFL
jgi:hypothetical protein